MTPNYSVYFGLMGKRFLSEKCCGLYWNEGCSLDLGSKNPRYIGMRVILECGFNWNKPRPRVKPTKSINPLSNPEVLTQNLIIF